jgi:hypothetical protein
MVALATADPMERESLIKAWLDGRDETTRKIKARQRLKKGKVIAGTNPN